MVYIFYGLNTYLIEKQITELRKKVDTLSYEKYDLEVSCLSEIVMHADEVSLFSSTQMIVVENAYIFTPSTNKKLPEQNISSLESYFKNPNPNTIFVFKIEKEKLDERKKIVKLAKEKGYLKECNKIDNPLEIVFDLFFDFMISKENAEFLVKRVGNNLSILQQEIEKIKLYKDKDKEITKEDLLLLTSQNIDTDLFNLIDAILMKNKKTALESYHEMMKLGEEPIMILVLLANQFRMIYQVKKLYQMGYSEKDISSELKVHWYPVRKTLGRMRDYEEKELLSYLKKLADLDIAIKKGEVDKNSCLEMFILNV
jgi:DNA polymerase-3 subunit delta